MEKFLASTCLTSREGRGPSRQFKSPINRQNLLKQDGSPVTPSLNFDLFWFPKQRSTEILQFIHMWCDGQELGIVMAATRETSNLSDNVMAYSFDYLKKHGKPNRDYERAAHRYFAMLEPEIDSCTISNQTQTVMNPPDLASSEPNASTSEILTQIISSVTIRGGKVHDSHHRSFPSMQLWCFSFIRMWKDVIRFLTKLRSSQARRLSQSLWAKDFSPLAAVRHDKSSPVIIAQEKTQSDVKCEVTPRSSRCAGLCAHLLCLHHQRMAMESMAVRGGATDVAGIASSVLSECLTVRVELAVAPAPSQHSVPEACDWGATGSGGSREVLRSTETEAACTKCLGRGRKNRRSGTQLRRTWLLGVPATKSWCCPLRLWCRHGRMTASMWPLCLSSCSATCWIREVFLVPNFVLSYEKYSYSKYFLLVEIPSLTSWSFSVHLHIALDRCTAAAFAFTMPLIAVLLLLLCSRTTRRIFLFLSFYIFHCVFS